MTRQELDAALARLGLDVPEKERDEIAAAAHLVEDMVNESAGSVALTSGIT